MHQARARTTCHRPHAHISDILSLATHTHNTHAVPVDQAKTTAVWAQAKGYSKQTCRGSDRRPREDRGKTRELREREKKDAHQRDLRRRRARERRYIGAHTADMNFKLKLVLTGCRRLDPDTTYIQRSRARMALRVCIHIYVHTYETLRSSMQERRRTNALTTRALFRPNCLMVFRTAAIVFLTMRIGHSSSAYMLLTRGFLVFSDFSRSLLLDTSAP